LSWNDNSINEEGFEIQNSDALGLDWSLAGNTSSGVTVFQDSDLACGSDFTYRVFAFNSGGYSASSNQVMTATHVCTPTLSLLPIEDGLIQLNWSDESLNESGFDVYTSTQSTSGFVKVVSLGPDEIEYSDDSAVCGQDFYYKVCAVGGGSGNQSCSEVQSDSTVCVPNSPSDLSAIPVSDSEINLDWIDNSDDETGFVILRAMTSRTGWNEVGYVDANVTTFTDSYLYPGQIYFYRIFSTNDGGVSGYSNLAHATTFTTIYLPVIFTSDP